MRSFAWPIQVHSTNTEHFISATNDWFVASCHLMLMVAPVFVEDLFPPVFLHVDRGGVCQPSLGVEVHERIWRWLSVVSIQMGR